MKSYSRLILLILGIMLTSCIGGDKDSSDEQVNTTVPPAQSDPPQQETPTSDLGKLLITWEPPQKKTDGTRLYEYELSFYEIYYRNTNYDYWYIITVPGYESYSTQSYTLTELEKGNYEIQLRTIDNNGLKSSKSGIIRTTVQ